MVIGIFDDNDYCPHNFYTSPTLCATNSLDAPCPCQQDLRAAPRCMFIQLNLLQLLNYSQPLFCFLSLFVVLLAVVIVDYYCYHLEFQRVRLKAEPPTAVLHGRTTAYITTTPYTYKPTSYSLTLVVFESARKKHVLAHAHVGQAVEIVIVGGNTWLLAGGLL